MISSTPGHPVYVRGHEYGGSSHRAQKEAARRKWYSEVDHRDGKTTRRLSLIGLSGYALLVAALVFTALAISSAAGDGPNAIWWGIATAAAAVLGFALLAFGRYVGTRGRPAGATGRAGQDPLQPEISAEEADLYEEQYHGEPGTFTDR